jgi:hypothetical protein
MHEMRYASMCNTRCRYGTQSAWYFSDLAGIQIAQTVMPKPEPLADESGVTHAAVTAESTAQPSTASGFAKLLLKPVVSCEYLLRQYVMPLPSLSVSVLKNSVYLHVCLSATYNVVGAGTWLLI